MYKIMLLVSSRSSNQLYGFHLEADGTVWSCDTLDELEERIEMLNKTIADNNIFPVSDISYVLKAEVDDVLLP
jgi:hypothetical protein